jgi:nucleotide-binding universal stress UspA family protein
VADQAATCQEDLAREREASLLVIASQARAGWLGASAERLVRSCALPMLFVPRR